MLTRKHLEALAVAFGDVERYAGADAHDVARIVINALHAAGGLTPEFSSPRFSAAVEEARPVPYTVA
jgi:hypothetical protein